MKRLLRVIAAAILGAGLVGGVAGASSAVIDTTGYDSNNEVRFDDRVDVDLDADNNTTGSISTDQDARSGDADVSMNTNAGDAETGDAENEAETDVTVESDNTGIADWSSWGANTGSNSATIRDTGADSNNEVVFDNSYELDVEVENNTKVTSSTNQNATSGSATTSQNTNGGGAMTGNASNSASTTVVITSMN